MKHKWLEGEVELTRAIDAASPVLTGRNDLYEKATEMVEYRHSRSSLINLVNFLLSEIDKRSDKEK